MKSIPITNITFDLPIYPNLLRKLRGAVVESVMQHQKVFEAAQVNTEVFHNHKEQILVTAEDDDQSQDDRFFHYPLVQYKIRHRKAGIVGIGKGAQAVQLWLSLIGDHLEMNGQKVSFQVHHHDHIQWKPTLLKKEQTYRLNKWLPLNAKNYQLWQDTPKLIDKVAILDKVIWGHIFHLSESLDFELDKEKFELYLSTIDMQTYKDCYGIKKLALDITFCTNLNLPEEIGLGQGVTIGFGKVQRIRKH